MDKEFEKWVTEFDKTWKESKSYNAIAGSNGNHNEISKQLLAWYLQYKSQEKLAKWTIWLVIATWTLAIATIILIFVKH